MIMGIIHTFVNIKLLGVSIFLHWTSVMSATTYPKDYMSL